MIETLKQCVWKNFAACIDMLHNAIVMWPDDIWHTNKKFFYNAYHCIVFLDYYLTAPPHNFIAALTYTITDINKIPEDAIDDVVPDRMYSKKEMLDYLQSSWEKCRQLIAGFTEEKLTQPWINQSEDINLELASRDSLNYSVLEILFYNMRHVQHHAAQLNLLLRQTVNNAPDYVSMSTDDL